MKIQQAVAFLVLGCLLFKLPQIAPALCQATSFEDSSARVLWLGLMGLVNGGIGIGRLCAGAWDWVHPWLEYPATHGREPARLTR